MLLLLRTKITLVFFTVVILANSRAQTGLQLSLNLAPEQCLKGSASLRVTGPNVQEVSTHWSTGEVNVLQVGQMETGDHNVSVRIKYKPDTVVVVKDTLLYFTLDKLECPVGVSKFFSPNDDQYNDFLSVSNLEYYPNFEFDVFNKWGQRVHSQKREYKPWDGKWMGVDLPDGTYYYVLFFDASKRNKLIKGDITILR